MSNNNAFWGKRFGFLHKDGTQAFVVRQFSTGRANTGDRQQGLPIHSPAALAAIKAKKLFEQQGRPVYFYDGSTGKRIHA